VTTRHTRLTRSPSPVDETTSRQMDDGRQMDHVGSRESSIASFDSCAAEERLRHEHLTAHVVWPAGSDQPAKRPEPLRTSRWMESARSRREVVSSRTSSCQPHPLCVSPSKRAAATKVTPELASNCESCLQTKTLVIIRTVADTVEARKSSPGPLGLAAIFQQELIQR
jgi:hypothetical protein